MLTEEVARTCQVFAENLQHWLALPVADKIAAIVASIKESGSDKAKCFDALHSKTRYPFGPNIGCETHTSDICIHSGRIKLEDGKLVDWQIWKSEHVVHIICW